MLSNSSHMLFDQIAKDLGNGGIVSGKCSEALVLMAGYRKPHDPFLSSGRGKGDPCNPQKKP
jgi:hypothetical protein